MSHKKGNTGRPPRRKRGTPDKHPALLALSKKLQDLAANSGGLGDDPILVPSPKKNRPKSFSKDKDLLAFSKNLRDAVLADPFALQRFAEAENAHPQEDADQPDEVLSKKDNDE